MRSKHYDKYITNLLEGIIFITIGIFLIYYSVIAGVDKQSWYLWAAGITIVLNTGLYLLGSAFVHKVKSDFIKKQKQRREEFQDFTIEQ